MNCLKCINSACCKLEVEVNKTEYNKFWKLDLDKHFDTRTDLFLKENPKYIKQMKTFDEMYKDNFAILKKGNDGQCVLLDRKTMKCTIYEDRPKVCVDFSNKSKRCLNIRELKN